MGQFCLFTYIRPFLETGVGITGPELSFVLLLMGIMGFIGSTLVGGMLKFGLYKILAVIPVLLAIIAVLLVNAVDSKIAIMMLLGLWGLITTAAPVAWWTWLAKTMPSDSEISGGLLVAIIQLAIGFGSTIGGVLFDHSGYQSTFYLSAMILTLSLFLVIFCAKRPQE